MPSGYHGKVTIKDGLAIKDVSSEDNARREAEKGCLVMSLPHAIEYFCAPTSSTRQRLIMPDCGSILHYSKVTNKIAAARHLLKGLMLLHRHNIIHGDIKRANIVINDREQIRYIDFWRPERFRLSSLSAPEEYLFGPHISKKIDCYRLGLVIEHLLPGHPIVEGLTNTDPSKRYTAAQALRILNHAP